MKGLGWIVAGIIAVWFLFFRRAAGGTSTDLAGPVNASTSAGINFGGTASPGADVIPLQTVQNSFGTGYRRLPPVYAPNSTNAFVSPTPPRVIVANVPAPPSVNTIRPYYLPPATPYRSIA